MQSDPTPTAAPRVLVRTSPARLIATLYQRATPTVRLRLLSHLLQPVGPLALAAIAAGAFGKLLPRERWTGARLTVDDAQGFDAWQIAELVRYVEQKCPEWLLQLPQGVGDSRLWLGGAAGALLLMLLKARAPRR